MNLTEKARKGSREAMEELFDSTKTDVMYLSTLLLGSDKVASTAVPRIYRSLWEQLLAGRLTSEEEFTQAAIPKTVTFCKTLLGKKDPKIFRIPSNRDFVQGIGENVSVKGEAWEVVLKTCRPCTDSSICSLPFVSIPRPSWRSCSTPMRRLSAWPWRRNPPI